METNELIKKIKQGDKAAFEQLYENFVQRIFRYVRFKIQNRQEAEDILQDVFIKAYRGIADLSMENLNFAAWLYRIAGNTINDHFRKRYRTPDIRTIDENFDLASNVSVYKEVEILSDMEIARAAFSRLPAVYKLVLELRFIQDFSPAEVGKILKKSQLAVRLLQYRALKKVRLILSEHEYMLYYQKIKKTPAF